MDLGLKGKVALVTGAGSQIGYGKGIALTLAREGCDIVAADIDLEGAKKTAAEVEALGRKAIAIKVDVRNRAEVDDMVKRGAGEIWEDRYTGKQCRFQQQIEAIPCNDQRGLGL